MLRRSSLACLAAAALVVGCTDITMLGDEGFFAFALTEDTPPFAMAEDNALFLVEERVEFPIREPTGEQLAELMDGAMGLGLTIPRLPWVELGDYDVEVDYLLINLDDASHDVTLTVNGINEFYEYSPGVVIDDDDIFAEFAGWERTVELGPEERVSGTVRREQLEEIAIDLATVVDPAITNPNAVVHPDSFSETDPRFLAFVPEIVPGLVGLEVGMRTLEEANVVCEFTVRIRETKNRVVAPQNAWAMPAPMIFEPSSRTMGVAP